MKKIVVGLDGSPRERGVLDAAIGLARKTGAKLVLMRGVGIPQEMPTEALAVAPAEVPELLQRVARAALDKVATSVPSELLGGCRTAFGTPWQSITSVASEENADLIVIGSHGYGGIDRVLGTTAAKVVNHADRSVLVVRAPERLA
jgi:nucleotide-binding universal stress UspA family protein